MITWATFVGFFFFFNSCRSDIGLAVVSPATVYNVTKPALVWERSHMG